MARADRLGLCTYAGSIVLVGLQELGVLSSLPSACGVLVLSVMQMATLAYVEDPFFMGFTCLMHFLYGTVILTTPLSLSWWCASYVGISFVLMLRSGDCNHFVVAASLYLGLSFFLAGTWLIPMELLRMISLVIFITSAGGALALIILE